MDAIITIGIICVVGFVAHCVKELGRPILNEIKSIIKWNLERFR